MLRRTGEPEIADVPAARGGPLCPVMPQLQVQAFRTWTVIVNSLGRYGAVDKQSIGHTFESRRWRGLREVQTGTLFSDAAICPFLYVIMKQPDGGASLKWVALPREVSVIRAGDQEHGGGLRVFCWHGTYR